MRAIFLLTIFMAIAVSVLAQEPPQQGPQLSPEVQDLTNRLSEVGCRAEVVTAAQTIDQLQKQVAELQKRINDPPKPAPSPSAEASPMAEPSPVSGAPSAPSGATKH